MTRPLFILASLLLTALIVYLFVSAPSPLPEQAAVNANIPVERVFALVEGENDAARALWTREIVGAGKKAGLGFSEDWREAGEEAGPLPALFLRETAKNLERNPVRLSLFLGSDAPINSANRFEGLQQEAFARIRATGEPQYFRMPDTRLYTAMFPDEAVAEACVTCHNEHEDSPKNDWKLHDVMGATTWSYPEDRLTAEQMISVLAALRTSIRGAYQAYLDKAVTFSKPPEIGARWPRDGYYLPSADVFMAALGESTAAASLDALLNATAPPSPGIRRRHTVALGRADMPWLTTGALLTAAFVAQAIWGWRWEWLSGLQESELYKQLSGLALVLFFLMQWRLSVARMGSASPTPRLLTLHRDLGALAPLLLYLHAISFGYAYIRAMSIAFLGLVALGLLQQPLARLNSNRLNTAWLVVHVTLATALPFFIGYHAFNAFYYE